MCSHGRRQAVLSDRARTKVKAKAYGIHHLHRTLARAIDIDVYQPRVTYRFPIIETRRMPDPVAIVVRTGDVTVHFSESVGSVVASPSLLRLTG